MTKIRAFRDGAGKVERCHLEHCQRWGFTRIIDSHGVVRLVCREHAPASSRRPRETDPRLNLSDEEIDSIRSGRRSVLRKTRPELSRGDRVWALWSEPRSAYVPEDKISRTPAQRWDVDSQPLLTLVVEQVRARTIDWQQWWEIVFRAESHEPERTAYLARGYGYTSDPKQSPDDQPVIDPDTLKTAEMRTRLKNAKRNKVSELSARNQELIAREELHALLRDLEGPAREAYLAEFKRLGDRFRAEQSEAA